MTRDEVIRGLECCLAVTKCGMCPYNTEDDLWCGNNNLLLEDALVLLKAQEPVEPKKNDVELAGLRTWEWACPECNCILIYRANYCSCCGRAVRWE